MIARVAAYGLLAAILALTFWSAEQQVAATRDSQRYARLISLASHGRMLSRQLALESEQFIDGALPAADVLSTMTRFRAERRRLSRLLDSLALDGAGQATRQRQQFRQSETTYAALEEASAELLREATPDRVAVVRARAARLFDEMDRYTGSLVDASEFTITRSLRIQRRGQRLVVVLLFLAALGVVEPALRAIRRQQEAADRRRVELERLSLAARSTTNGVAFTDAARRITWVNTAFTRMTGYSAAEAMGQSPGALLQCERSDPATIARMREALDAGRGIQCEIINRAKDGREYWVYLDIQPIHDQNGTLTGFVAIDTDITHQRRQSEALSLAIDGAQLGTWEYDAALNVFTADARNLALMGRPGPGRVIREDEWPTMVLPEDVSVVQQAMADHFTGRTAEIRAEYRVGDPQSPRWLLVVGRIVERNPDGTPRRAGGVNIDITVRKQLERDISIAQQRYMAAISGTSDGLWEWRLADASVWYSPRCAELLEMPPGRQEGAVVTSEAFVGQLHPEDQAMLSLAFSELIRKDTPLDLTVRLRVGNRGHRAFRLRGRAERTDDGRAVSVAGSLQDIDAAQRTLRELAKARERAESALREVRALRTALDQHLILSVTDPAGRIIEVNTGFLEITGLHRFDVIGQNHRLLASGVHDAAFWSSMWGTISAGHAWRGTIANRRSDGTLYWVDSTVVPHLNADGAVEKYVAISFDVTAKMEGDAERERLAAQLAAANSELLAANRTLEEATARSQELARGAAAANQTKSEFLANMSHEIRTPLSAILGYTELLADDVPEGESGARQRASIDTVRRAGEHLLALINDILDLSRVEAGRLDVERIETALPEILLDVDSLMRSRAGERGVELFTRLETPIPSHVFADPTRLRQILMNLVGNAVKFTVRGRVSLRVRTLDLGTRLAIAVEDTGPGISAEQVARLFQPFSQADASVTREHGGTGLGLVISRRLAELMGGTVELTWSTPGVGSCFTLVLPFTAAPEAQDVTALEVRPERSHGAVAEAMDGQQLLAGQCVLVVEDGEVNRQLIVHHLKTAGAEVITAENGRVALELLSAPQGARVQLIVSDMQMPEMDGYTLARLLRGRGDTRPIVALTANAMADDRRKCLEAGCSDYTTKPIDRRLFVALCARWLSAGEHGGPITPAPVPSSAPVETGTPGPAGDGHAIDREDFGQRTVHQPALQRAVLELLLTHCPPLTLELDRAFEAGEFEAAVRTAHRLRGSAGSVGALRWEHALRAVEERLEEHAGEGATPEAKAGSLTSTRQEIAALVRLAIAEGEATFRDAAAMLQELGAPTG